MRMAPMSVLMGPGRSRRWAGAAGADTALSAAAVVAGCGGGGGGGGSGRPVVG